MSKYGKWSARSMAKAAGVGFVAGGLLLGAPAGLAFADDPVTDAGAAVSTTVQKAVVAGSQTTQQAVVAGSAATQKAVVAGSQTVQKAGTATSNTVSNLLKGLFGH
jgi:hypothetical protein